MLLLTKEQTKEIQTGRYLTNLGHGLKRLRKQCLDLLSNENGFNVSISIKFIHKVRIKHNKINEEQFDLLINKTLDNSNLFRPIVDNCHLNVDKEYTGSHLNRLLSTAIHSTNRVLKEITFDPVVYSSVFEQQLNKILLREGIKNINVKPMLSLNDNIVSEIHCTIF